jgi:hypothetical protein
VYCCAELDDSSDPEPVMPHALNSESFPDFQNSLDGRSAFADMLSTQRSTEILVFEHWKNAQPMLMTSVNSELV